MKKKVSVVITDLDNTLYDWFGVWHKSFSSLLDELVSKSGHKRDFLISEIKKVHQKYGTSEYIFLIDELECLRKEDADVRTIYRPALEAYQEVRAANLRLYPFVLCTLKELKSKGCLIISYTESLKYYTTRAIHKLG